MQEYWVNVYMGMPAYCCSKQPTREASIDAMNKTTYNYPVYRIHVKMKPKFRFNEVSHNYTSKDIFKRDDWMG